MDVFSFTLSSLLGTLASLRVRHQLYKAKEVGDPEEGAAGRDDDEWILGTNARPARRQATKTPVIVVEVDSLLAPNLAQLDQHELPSIKRVKGVSDSENLLRI